MNTIKITKNSRGLESPVYDFIVSVDFDGTLFEEDWPNVGLKIGYIHDVINYCYKQGYIIVLNTLREGKVLEKALQFIELFEVPIHLVNVNVPHRVIKYNNARKLGYDIHIDDRNAGGLLTKQEYLNAIDRAFMERDSRLLFPEEIDAIDYAWDNDYWIEETHYWSHLEDELESCCNAVDRSNVKETVDLIREGGL